MREIREYRSLREVIELDEIPSSSATGGWLKRVGVEGMEGVNDGIDKKVLRKDGRRG